jgi:hypothetical protein
VFGVPPNTFLPPFDPWERSREDVGRGTHPTASETLALPGPDPLKTSRKQKKIQAGLATGLNKSGE